MPRNLVDGTQIATFSGFAISRLSKAQLKQTTNLVCLSITGNPHCVGADLQIIIEQSIKNHGETIFLIGDETHWHNLKGAPVVSEEEKAALKEQAIAMGSKYLQDNLPAFLAVVEQLHPEFNAAGFYTSHADKSPSEHVIILNQLAVDFGIPFQIVRWREWVANGKHAFATKQSEISSLYDSEETLKSCLDKATADFVRRHRKKIAPENVALFTQRSRDYLREETPAIFWIAAALGIDFVAYPGTAPKLFWATRDYFIAPQGQIEHAQLRIQVKNPELLANWVEINFRKQKPIFKKQKHIIDMSPTQRSTAEPHSFRRSQSCETLISHLSLLSDGFFRPIRATSTTKAAQIESSARMASPTESIFLHFMLRFNSVPQEEGRHILEKYVKEHGPEQPRFFAQELLTLTMPVALICPVARPGDLQNPLSLSPRSIPTKV